MKWIGIILLGFSMAEIYPITDWKSALVMFAFWIGLNLFVDGEIGRAKGDGVHKETSRCW